ncbi:MAG TPA: hypothetical protein VID04_07825 [Methylomirabilota bacterium]
MRLVRLILLVLLACAAGCGFKFLPVCTNGPGDVPGECIPKRPSPPPIGPQTA